MPALPLAGHDRAPRGPEQSGAHLPSALAAAQHSPQHPAALPPSAAWRPKASAKRHPARPAAEPPQRPPPESSARVWGRGPLAHYWTLGHRHADLDALFAALPDSLSAPLRHAAATAATCSELRLAALRAAVQPGAADGACGGEAWAGGPLQEPGELWEAEEEAGFFSVSLDPETGRRRGVAMNRRHAELMGAAGREELLGLVRWDEARLAVPEMDLLVCLMHELANAAEARTELYLRVARGGGAAGAEGGALLRCVKVKEFDRLGRIVRVRLRAAGCSVRAAGAVRSVGFLVLSEGSRRSLGVAGVLLHQSRFTKSSSAILTRARGRCRT